QSSPMPMRATSHPLPGLRAAHERTDRVDAALQRFIGRLTADAKAVAVVALGAYGRRELTPLADVETLFLYDRANDAEQFTRSVTEAVCYPLWAQHLRIEPLVRTVSECAADARRSLAVATGLIDARRVDGDPTLYAELERRVTLPLRRDHEHLRQLLRFEVQRRHAAHPPV